VLQRSRHSDSRIAYFAGAWSALTEDRAKRVHPVVAQIRPFDNLVKKSGVGGRGVGGARLEPVAAGDAVALLTKSTH
jgi:hypothetical protein